jgi:hypothetical protein
VIKGLERFFTLDQLKEKGRAEFSAAFSFGGAFCF